jgi:hypothetical protein
MNIKDAEKQTIETASREISPQTTGVYSSRVVTSPKLGVTARDYQQQTLNTIITTSSI